MNSELRRDNVNLVYFLLKARGLYFCVCLMICSLHAASLISTIFDKSVISYYVQLLEGLTCS